MPPRLPRIPGHTPPQEVQDANAHAVHRIHVHHHREETEEEIAGARREAALDEMQEAWDAAAHAENPRGEVTVEVLRRVPWIQQRLLQSKWLGRLASPFYRNNSFGLEEYAQGADLEERFGEEGHDRRYQRYVVAQRMRGFVLPHVVRGDDRGRKRLPDARVPSQTHAEHRRRDALVLGADGQSSWTGALESVDRNVVAVGPDLGVIGVDNTRVERSTIWERVLDTFGIDHLVRRHHPNAAARGLEALHPSASQLGDITAKLSAIATHAEVLPPHPRDRRTPQWRGWGNNDANNLIPPRETRPPDPLGDEEREGAARVEEAIRRFRETGHTTH